MANPFVHLELNTTDVDKAKSFYSQLFDWKLDEMPMGDSTYTMIGVGNGTGGGMMKHPMGGPSLWIPYVQVDDVVSATAKAKSLGANMIRDVTEIPNVGWFSILMDPTGAVIALYKPKTSAGN